MILRRMNPTASGGVIPSGAEPITTEAVRCQERNMHNPLVFGLGDFGQLMAVYMSLYVFLM